MFLTLTLLQHCRQLRALALGWLLPVLLWTAVHPAVMNATQSTGQQIMLCTSQGMIWLKVVEQDNGGMTEQVQPANVLDDPATTWLLCPWCRHAGHWSALPLQEIPPLWLTPHLRQMVSVPVCLWTHATHWDFHLPLVRAPPL